MLAGSFLGLLWEFSIVFPRNLRVTAEKKLIPDASLHEGDSRVAPFWKGRC